MVKTLMIPTALRPLTWRIGKLWLGGLKYRWSRWLAGKDWDVSVALAAAQHHPCFARLHDAQSLQDIVYAFRGIVFWMPDPVFQLWNRVYPPELLFRRGGDNCDGLAMLHAQAVEFVLGRVNWRAYIASYVATDFTLSHHFALALDPHGYYWAIQPQPTKAQYEAGDIQQVFGPFETPEDAVRAVAAQYNTTVQWYDIRTSKFEKLPQS